MYQAKQQAGDLIRGPKYWPDYLPPEFSVELRIDAHTGKPHECANGEIKHCTDMQWWLGNGYVPGAAGTALKLMKDGEEVLGVFKR